MNECKIIYGLKLDSKSQKTIKRINDRTNAGKALGVALSVGVFSNIFTRSSAAQVPLNIQQTDWILYTNAMKAVPIITKRAIQTDIEMMIIEYELNYNRELLDFWKGMYHGCK